MEITAPKHPAPILKAYLANLDAKNIEAMDKRGLEMVLEGIISKEAEAKSIYNKVYGDYIGCGTSDANVVILRQIMAKLHKYEELVSDLMK